MVSPVVDGARNDDAVCVVPTDATADRRLSERSDRDAMADVHYAVVEPALVEQLELGAQFAR